MLFSAQRPANFIPTRDFVSALEVGAREHPLEQKDRIVTDAPCFSVHNGMG